MRGSRCLVTGATGAIGTQLVKSLVENGSIVTALVRQDAPIDLLPPSVTIVKGDLLNLNAVRKAASGVDTIFHLAAKLHLNNPGPHLKDEYRRTNLEGTRLLVDCAQAAQVRRFVYFSTINVYGPSQSARAFSEEDTPVPQGLYAQTKYEGEKYVLGALSADKRAPIGVVLRLAAVYGPHMKGNYPRLVRAVKRGFFIPVGDGLNRRTLVHERDVVAAAILAAQHVRAAGQVFNVTDGHVHTFNEILAAICQAVNRRPPRFHLPVAPFRLLAGLAEDVCRFVGLRSPIGRAAVDKLIEDVAVTGGKFQRETNFQPQFDLTRGWRDTMENSPSDVSRGW